MSTSPRRDGRMSWRTVLWLAGKGGRDDGTRIVLTAVGAALGTMSLLAAATVAAAGHGDGPYTSDLLNQPGLHPGIVIAFLLLCVPILGFVGQCSRIGAPARDRRLAAVRMQGGTPFDVVRIAAAETGLAAVLGAALGTGAFFVLRVLLGNPVTATYRLREQDGYTEREYTGPALRFPTDVLPPTPVLVLVVVVIPLLATFFAVYALRGVTFSPFGVVHREQHRPSRFMALLLFAGGTLALASFSTVVDALGLDDGAAAGIGLLFLVLFLVTGIGLLMSTTALAAAIGRLLVRFGERPSLLIAGRRLLASPSQSARTNAALLLVVLLWAFTQGFGANLLAGVERDEALFRTNGSFYRGALALVDLGFAVGALITAAGLLVGCVESVLTRRRMLASLAAVGVPRSVLARATVIESMAPLVPAVLAATAAGIFAARGALGTTVGNNGAEFEVGVPWGGLAAASFGTLLVVLLLILLTLPLLRRSTDPAELRAE
ncbi:hypothetical protein LWF15_21130 [Kineosporia rhizophila]|uniref:FtsX-like permease family protein n=1 Tax=Kineosporia rhizophila TaxID=84633 RepID=UPI001E52892E|nr:FtsX-like permease family protein [Kineosporia rhizophila]MCE0538000.1 hypothetical protein [Kineosporia rhizophila]